MKIELIDINMITEEDLIKTMDNNIKTYKLMKSEIIRLNKAKNSIKMTNYASPIISIKNNSFEENIKNNKDFEEEFGYYQEELNKLKHSELKDNINNILPVKKNKKFNKLTLRLKAECLKNIKEIKELISEEEYMSLSDLKSFKEEIQFEEEKIQLIDEYVNQNQSQNVKENHTNNLIFVPTSGGNIRVIDDIEHIDMEYYEKFIGLFDSIKDGSFKNVKRFNKNNNETSGVAEVKDFKVRVVFDRIDKNSYAIITAFTKKSDNDKGYIEPLKKKIAEYRNYEDILKSKVKDSKFIKMQQNYEQELYNILEKDIIFKKRGGK